MYAPTVLLPVFVQVFLTFFFLFWMARERLSAIKGGEVKVKDIALRQQAWPERVTQVANTFHNQLELPILFYVLVAFALFTHKADTLFVIMSWMFVATRLFHATIYATTNRIQYRFQVFAVGALILLVMWIIFALRILFAGMPG
ncbi:MAG TPA: MAPEG family protein [Beijerinckiaceae bacterium]|jgi:hypothetical protein